MLLAIDTSSLVLSCALAENDRLISEWTVQRKLTHSEQLIPHLDNMMKDAGVSREEITAVACSLGPGSFTGLRIGLASIKMMACIWDVPLIGVDTLEALAWNMAGGEAYALPIMDAQRGNVYAALYSVHGSEVIKEEQETVISIDELTEKVSGLSVPVTALGEAADKYADKPVSRWRLRLSAAAAPEVWLWPLGTSWKREKRKVRLPLRLIIFAEVRQKYSGN